MPFDGIDPNELIFSYSETDNNKIKVVYFTGRCEYFPLNKGKLILELERDQILAFLNSLDVKYLYDDDQELFDVFKRVIKTVGTVTCGLSLLGVLFLNLKQCNAVSSASLGILTVFDSVSLGGYLYENAIIKKDIDKVERYKLYMDNEEFFQNYKVRSNGIPLINPNNVEHFRQRTLKRALRENKKL